MNPVTSMMRKRRVVIVQRRLTDYRVPLFERLRILLNEQDIELVLLVGEGTVKEKAKRDAGYLPWAQVIPTRYCFSDEICWQPFWTYLHDADLVIVTQENKLIFNHLLLVMKRRFSLAFWGHGRNMQTPDQNSLRERFKKWSNRHVDWWFAYTEVSRQLVVASGFPVERITTLNNAIDTTGMCRDRDSITPAEIERKKAELQIADKPVGAFIGSLYGEKRLNFIFEACQRIRQDLPAFQWLIIGDGIERSKIQQWTLQHDWIHWVGAQKGRDKAIHLACADVLLNPSAVGLVILDSFIFGKPIVTTETWNHGPEIAYLKQGENGFMSPDDPKQFAEVVVSLLKSPRQLERACEACTKSAGEYSIENMASYFRNGILQALTLEQAGCR